MSTGIQAVFIATAISRIHFLSAQYDENVDDNGSSGSSGYSGYSGYSGSSGYGNYYEDEDNPTEEEIISKGKKNTFPSTYVSFEQYPCLSPFEIDAFREQLGLNNETLSIHNTLRIGTEEYEPPNILTAIILHEVFGFNVILHENWNQMKPLEYSFEILEMPYFDLNRWDDASGYLYNYNNPKVHMSFAGTYWNWFYAIQPEIKHQIENDLNATQREGPWLDIFASINTLVVVDEMTKPKDLNDYISCLDFRGTWNDDCEGYDCLHNTDGYGIYNCTYYPPQCDPLLGLDEECMVVIAFQPWMTYHLHTVFIEKHNLKWTVKYLGAYWNEGPTAALEQLIASNAKVIYEIWKPSIFDGPEWVEIAMPAVGPDNQITGVSLVFKAYSVNLKLISSFVVSGFIDNVMLTSEDNMDIYRAAFGKTGLSDGYPPRWHNSCGWIKQHNATWLNWVDTAALAQYQNIDCNHISDGILTDIVQYGTEDMNAENRSHIILEKGTAFLQDLAGSNIHDQFGLEYALRNCIDRQGEVVSFENQTVYVLPYYVALIGFITMMVSLIYIVKKRENPVIRASSLVMLITLVSGGCVGLVYPFLNDTSLVKNCYLPPVIFQVSFTMICGSISLKTWRLSYYIRTANALRKPRTITDLNLMIRLGCVMIAVGVYLWILFVVYPMDTKEIVFGARTFEVCEHHGNFDRFYLGLLLLECIHLIMVGQSVWSLRSLSAQFNESKWISVIMYHSCIFIVALIVIDENIIEMNSIQIYFAKSIIVELFVFVSVFGLLIPKFVLIVKDVKFWGDVVAKDVIQINTNAMTKQDVKKIRRLLSKFGWELKKRSSVQLSKTDPFTKYGSKPTSTSRRETNTLSMSSTGRKDSYLCDEDIFPQMDEELVASEHNQVPVEMKVEKS